MARGLQYTSGIEVKWATELFTGSSIVYQTEIFNIDGGHIDSIKWASRASDWPVGASLLGFGLGLGLDHGGANVLQ